ncbi:hypothetical protein QYH69_27380 [Paraburkholderia sp. SARCC-3016]|uniref:hypothetical protein n=1 Tax=Paraburkholderia sp. SARCC-3016 TaxID=3058611 RepID=UPI0028074047|nr:hypothetical protein [Paraburkholderia sp. SARCC-3016]MDQ7980963.1 hypothetical protein [Paraburkholderia sp. SARCC-3016]
MKEMIARVRTPSRRISQDRWRHNKLMRAVLLTSLLLPEFSWAQVQGSYESDQSAARNKMSVVTAKVHRDQEPDRYPSGFNIGPTRQIVEGCVGPLAIAISILEVELRVP